MKVALFIEKFDTARGGRERSTAEIARLLTDRGVDVTVVCKTGSCDIDGVKLIQTGTTPLGKLGAAMSFNRRCHKVIARGNFDITHSVFPLVGADVYQLRNGVIPAVRDAHLALGGPMRKFSWPLNFARLYQWGQERRVIETPATMCLPVSDKVAADITKYYGPRDNIRTVFNGICRPDDFDANCERYRRASRKQWGASDDMIVLLSLANNHQLKGIRQLVKVFTRANSADGVFAGRAKLVIVGSGERPASVPDGVIFSPPVSDVFPLYAGADAAVLLSWYDACSRVVLEACSAGLPCVTTRCNGAAEVLADGAGVVVDSPDSFDQLAAAFKTLASEKSRAAMASVAAGKTEYVSMARHVDELLEIYKQILDNRK